MTDNPHRTGYMRVINLARRAVTRTFFNRNMTRLDIEILLEIRDRLRKFVDLYKPHPDPVSDTIMDGIEDGVEDVRLAVADVKANIDARRHASHHVRPPGRDSYAVNRFFDELEARLATIDYT